MSKREVYLRHMEIIRKLEKFPATLKEINNHLERQSEILGYNFSVSKRTFQRDLDDIRSIYNIHISYDFSLKKYIREENDSEELSFRMLETLDTFNALNSSMGFSNYVDFEERKSAGLENFYGLLHAIKNKHQVVFTHQSYCQDNSTKRTVEPYFLKEFKNRWYLIANDLVKNETRTFGLDRIKDLEISKKKFTYPAQYKPGEYFKHSFGIIGSAVDLPLKTIVLWFSAYQGKYIKSLPLHSSQEIIKDDADGLVIRLKLHLTFDFEMELLSCGPNVKVIEPQELKDSLKAKLQEALKYYTRV